MIVRSLLRRIGVEPDSPQLRIVGTSTSLDDSEGGLEYLEQFFGVERSSFAVLPESRWICPSEPFSRADIKRRARPLDEVSRLISLACAENGTGRLRATSTDVLAARLFPEAHDRNDLLADVLDQLAEGDGDLRVGPLVPLRAHLFVRTPRGLWACSDPNCLGVEGPEHAVRWAASSPRRSARAPRAGAGCWRSCTAMSAAT